MAGSIDVRAKIIRRRKNVGYQDSLADKLCDSGQVLFVSQFPLTSSGEIYEPYSCDGGR